MDSNTAPTNVWFRRLDSGFIREPDGVHVSGKGDLSPQHLMYPTGRDPDCACCWLNMCHSEEKHLVHLGKEPR